MKKASEEIIQEVRKRQPDKPLSLTELAQLREIQYMYLKKEQCVQDLLVHYCRDQRFQIRVCEKAFLMTTIVPLLQFENPVDVIKNGAKLIACLSENEETHKKIIKSDALRTLAALIEIQLHHDITKYGLKTIANLCRIPNNFNKVLELGLSNDKDKDKEKATFLEMIVRDMLQIVPNHSQLYILNILLNMTSKPHANKESLCKLLLKKRLIRPILKSIVSSNIDVATEGLLTINHIIENGKNLDRLLKLKLPPKLLLTYQLFQHHDNSIKIKTAIMKTLENLLKIKEFQQQLVSESYQSLCLSMFETNIEELSYYGISCIAYMSELVESHDKLVEKKVLELIYQISKEIKHQKIRQQAFKIISGISLNPKYLQTLINMGMIDLLVNSLNSDEKTSKKYSILSLSNLSCSQNFHKYISNINIKLLIDELQVSDEQNHHLLLAVSNTLANISIDHNYQSHFLKDPQKSIILKLLYLSKDLILIRSIIIIFANISTNGQLLQELGQADILQCLFELYQRDHEVLRGYLSRCLSALSILPECRKLVIQKGLMKSLVSNIYQSTKETKRMLLLSIMMLLSFSEEFQKQFILEQGTDCLIYLMGQSDNFHAYIAAKSFVLISRMESSLAQVARKSVCESMVLHCLGRERRILKEGLRFFVNIIIHKRPKSFVIDQLCLLTQEVLKGDEPDALQLGLFAFMLMSEQQIYHETVMKHDELLIVIATKSTGEIKIQNAIFLAIAIMNFSLNVNNLDNLLKFKLVRVMRDLCQFVSKDSEKLTEFDLPTYMFTFLRQLLKINDLQEKLQEIFAQGATIILQALIVYDKQYYFQSLLECINIMISMSDNYPADILSVIRKLADIDYQNNDEQSIPLRVYVLNRMSYNPASLEYFKYSRIVPFLKDKIYNDPQFINISQYFCSLMANISKESVILNEIFDADILKLIFKVREYNNNIKLTDVIRLLAHLSSHHSFKPEIFSEEIYSNIFDHLQMVTQQDRGDPSLYYPVLICILNMTKSDFGLIKAISRSDIFKFIKVYLKDFHGPRHITILCFLTISNMLIDPDILNAESDILSLINDLRQSIVIAEENNEGQIEYIIVSFLKVIHNLVLCHYAKVQETQILQDCIADIQRFFQKYNSQEILGLILSIFCALVENPVALANLKSNYPVMIKIFDLLHHNYEKLDSSEQRFRSSLLLLLANLSYYEHSFDFFETFLNIEDFMSKYKNAYHNLSQQADKDLLLTILVNLTYIKEIQLIIHKYEKPLSLIKDIFLQEYDDQTTRKVIQLFANLSLNQELHSWIASQDILKRLEKLFVDSSTPKTIKEQIQILLANTTFTEDVHEVLITNGAIKIFESIVNKKESIQQETSHQQVVSLVNLGLNPRTYALIENQFNMVNSLSLLDECEKPLQIKLLRAALEYVVDDASQNLTNKKEILQFIITNINILLETKSKFLVCKIDPLWQMILSSDLIITARFDKERLLSNFVTIIVHFDMLEVKCNYFHYLCELSDKTPSMLDTPQMAQYLQLLFTFNLNSLAQLKELHNQVRLKQQVDMSQVSKYEQLINLFLKIISNVAFAQKNLNVFIQRKEFEDHLLEICSYAHSTCNSLIIQSLATYANLFQVDSKTYQPVFEIITKNYKQHIKQFALYQTFLIGVIVGVMKNRKYLLTEEPKDNLAELNDSVQSYQNKHSALYQMQQNTIFQKRVSSQQTFISIRSQESDYYVSKDMNLVISVLLYVLKKGHPPNLQPAATLLLQCLTNIAYQQDNFRQLLSTKLPEYLFIYLQQKENMVADGYVYAITAFINLSTTKEFYLRIQPEEVYHYVVKLNEIAKPLVIQYSSSIFMQMFEYGETDDKQNYVEFTLNFMVNEVLASITFDSEYMDLFLAFLERLLKISKLKYKIAKIESLFVKFQKTLEAHDLSSDKHFEKYWRIWNIYSFLITSKECLFNLVRYGYFNLIRVKLEYFTTTFEQFAVYRTQIEHIEKHKLIMKQLQIFTIIISSLERIFRSELNQKLTPALSTLIFSTRNEKVDIVRVNNQDSLKISFYAPFLILEKVILSEETYKNNQIIIVIEAINQIALLLSRMESNGEVTLQFLIEILHRTFNLQDEKTIFYYNVVNIAIKLFEKFGADISKKIEETLDLLIQHWAGSDYRFMNTEIYQNFLRVCILFKFKDCVIIKPQILANQVLSVMILNQTTFREIETQLLFQMFLKKLIAEIDPSESVELEEAIQESIDFLLEYIQKQSANIKAQIDIGDKAINEYQKTLQQQNFSMTIEILTILISFNAFQEKISNENVLTSIIECGLLIQQLLQFFENKEVQTEELKTAQNQLQSFLKHISILLSYASFLLRFHEELQTHQCNNLIFDNILKRKKQTKIFCFNIIVNLIESIGPNYMFEVLQLLEEQIDNINENEFLHRYSLDAIVSLIEEIYQKVQHYKQIAPQEQIFHQISEDICMLLTKVIVGKKHNFSLNSSLEILLTSLNPEVQMRTHYLILKKYINCDTTQQLRDKVAVIAFQSAETLFNEMKGQCQVECISENMVENQDKLINIKYTWDQIRKNQICAIDEMFFWETLEMSPFQQKLILLIFCLENVTARIKNEQMMSKPLTPNPAQIVHSLLTLIDDRLDHFLDGINLKYQLNFLILYYAASISYASLGNRIRKSDFSLQAEKDPSFKLRLIKCVQVLLDSKINILVNFAELIKIQVNQL